MEIMQINVIYYKPHTKSLEPCILCYSFPKQLIDFLSCEVVSSSDMRKNIKLCIITVGRTLRMSFMLIQCSCKMIEFCDVLHESKQKRKQTLKSAKYSLEIISKT